MRIIEYNGIKKTITEWSKELHIDRTTIQKRLDIHGWSVERALTKEHGNERLLEFNGEIKNLKQWSKIKKLSTRTIAARLDNYGWTISEALTRPNNYYVEKIRKINFTTEQKTIIIDRHVNKHETTVKIAKDYNCSSPVIQRLLSSCGVYKPLGCRKYFFNEDYFSNIDTPRKAYWLGLFYADGCNYNNSIFSISFKHEDRYILEKLANDVDYQGPIYDYEQVKSINGRDKKAYPKSEIALCSKQFCVNLANNGVVSNKTFRLQFPNIPHHLQRHFVRGLFDGDGFISHAKSKRGLNEGRTFIVWGIVGQKELLESVNDVLCKEINISKISVKRKTGENCWVVQYGTSIGDVRRFAKGRLDDILKIKDWLYQDACIFFRRKKNDFDVIKTPPERSGLSIEEAAMHIGVSKSYLSQICVQKQMGLLSYKEGMYTRFNKENVEAVKLRRKV